MDKDGSLILVWTNLLANIFGTCKLFVLATDLPGPSESKIADFNPHIFWSTLVASVERENMAGMYERILENLLGTLLILVHWSHQFETLMANGVVMSQLCAMHDSSKDFTGEKKQARHLFSADDLGRPLAIC